MQGVLLPVVAFAAGALSITSPCILPLLPAYLSVVATSPATGEDERSRRRSRLLGSMGFVLGFTLVFTLLGATASVLGRQLLASLPVLTRLAGALIIVLGLFAGGFVKFPALMQERRLDLHHVGSGPARSIPLGIAFAVGWTPCIGPVLASILTLAAANNSLSQGIALLVVYSLGLGLPFVGLALSVDRLQRASRFLQRHGRFVERAGGVLMIVVGIGYVTTAWSTLFVELQRRLARLGWPPL